MSLTVDSRVVPMYHHRNLSIPGIRGPLPPVLVGRYHLCSTAGMSFDAVYYEC